MERWQQIESLFQEALQRNPAERDAWLREACLGDSGLHREVASLLANHHEATGFEPWAAAAAAQIIDRSASLQAGQRLGPYEILELIGVGGMGEVYKARDTRLRRDVAIKICAAQFSERFEREARTIASLNHSNMVYKARDTRLRRDVAIKICAAQFSERFEREARTIASLNHSNICQLYDVGPNFLVMELVEGENIAGPLPIETALNYARQIAEALEAAHYTSSETGRNEVYVRPFPRPESARIGRVQVSSAGGRFPIWSRGPLGAGRELFFLDLDGRIMVADYTTNRDSFTAAKPQVWSDKVTDRNCPGIINSLT